MDPNAQKVIDNCQFLWPANQRDCSGFVKAVCTGLAVAMSPGQADDIVAYFRDPFNQWTPLIDVLDATGAVTKRKEQVAKEAADDGLLVLCGLTSTELNDTNGHVAVIISAALVHSRDNNNDYPVGYWGELRGTGGANKIITYAFTTPYINDVTYASKAF
jgi:hypothetical protein